MVVFNALEDDGRALLQMLDMLKTSAQGSSAITVRILAAADHDGVCATKILVTVLEKSGVKYTVVPVTGNTEIIEHLQQLEEDAEVRSLVLLNCGASLDLQRQLEECEAPLDVRCFVVDAHRPLLLANLSARHQRVIVLDDDPIAEASGMKPPVDEPEGGSGSEAASARDEGSDAEKENVWDPDAAAADGAARQKPPGQLLAERRDRKRRREAERQAKLERKRQKVNEYYLASYYATPVALSLFKMARQAAPPSQDLLWLAAVSLAGYHDQGLVSEVEYNRLAWEELKETLDRGGEYRYSGSSQAAGSTVPDAPSDDEEPAPTRRRPPRGPQRQGRLRFEEDLRLTLYRHWTLEDSLMHSSYFYGSLELYRDKGLRELKQLLAASGIPPSDYRQMYSAMSIMIRKTLLTKFKVHGKRFGLTETKMFLQQIVRDFGPREEMNVLWFRELSCMDAVHIMAALLSSVPPELTNSRLGSLPLAADGRRDTAAINALEREAMVANFWRAFDAVLCMEPKQLHEAISEAVEAAKQVQQLGRLVRDTKAVHSSRQFNWCKIEQPPQLFRHPLAVRRLAVWLLHVLFSNRAKGSQEKPLLVMVRDKVRDTYLCVGATPHGLSEGQDEFGNRFRSVLRSDRSLRYRYDFFDKSCIEVAADDFERFWELMSASPV